MAKVLKETANKESFPKKIDSDRVITLAHKKKKAREFHKSNVKYQKIINKLKFINDSPKERIIGNHSDSEASDVMLIDNKITSKRLK